MDNNDSSGKDSSSSEDRMHLQMNPVPHPSGTAPALDTSPEGPVPHPAASTSLESPGTEAPVPHPASTLSAALGTEAPVHHSALSATLGTEAPVHHHSSASMERKMTPVPHPSSTAPTSMPEVPVPLPSFALSASLETSPEAPVPYPSSAPRSASRVGPSETLVPHGHPSSGPAQPPSPAESHFNDGVKRAVAQQLIKAYFTQLTDGCGNPRCNNDICASCPVFRLKNKDRNALAVYSVQLVKQKGQLCKGQDEQGAAALIPNKDQTHHGSSWKHGLPGPSSSGATGTTPKSGSAFTGTTPKSTASTPIEKEDCFLNEEKLVTILDHCKATSDWSALIKTIGSVFSNPDALIMSFRSSRVQTKLEDMDTEMGTEEDDHEMEVDTEIGAKEHRHSMDIDSEKDVDEKEEKEDSESGERIQSDSAKHNSSEFEDVSGICNEDITVDLKSLRRCYGMLVDIADHPFQGALIQALTSLAKAVQIDLLYAKSIQRIPNFLNMFAIVMEIPFLHSPEFIERAYPEICKAIGQLSVGDEAKLSRYWSTFSAGRLNEMVLSIQQLLTVKIIDGELRWGRGYNLNDEDYITGPIKVMKILYYASLYGGERDPKELLDEERAIQESDNHLQQELRGAGAMRLDFKEPRQAKDDPLAKELNISHVDCRRPLVAYEDFVNETLNEHINVEVDYRYKLESEETPGKFTFTNYSFIMTTASKQMSLYMDNRIQMYRERRQSILETLMHGLPQMPLLRVRVSRDTIIADALVALESYASDNPAELRKQLFVEFEGEQGLDEGGVSKEFFQLIIEEIFNVDFGMFTYNSETHQFWFNSMSFENDGQFLLIGIVLGLAIYNSTIVDVHFPAVVYRKLVSKKGMFEDLGDVDPVLKKSLDEMMAYEGDDLEEVFMQSFQISYKDVFGSTLTQDLKEKGDEIPVTQANKQEFVNLYSDFILNKSIEKQFRAFRRGFQLVTNESPLRSLFRPDEIELLVCGSEQLDFAALEESCEYDGGFDRFSRSIRNFWEIVHSLSEEQKRKLLQFTTGTDRVPVGGLSKLKLIIARNGPDSERLPTAHTCFNVLLLPDYDTKHKLEERLLKAITYSKGFGML